MTVYVDDMLRPTRVGRLTSRWSHLMADTHEELMEFAARMKLQPAWLQHPGSYREHFDLTEPRRTAALRMGAQAITYPHGTAEILRRKRLDDPSVRLAGRYAALMALVDEPDEERP